MVDDLMRERGVARTEAAQRVAWQSKADDLERRLQRELGPRFGGVWIGADDDRVKVGIVGARRDVSRSVASLGLTSAVDVLPVTRSAQSLEQAHSWIAARLEAANAGAPALLGVSLKVDENVVELQLPPGVTLTEAQRALVAEARRRHGSLLKQVEGPPPSERTLCTRAKCDPPLRGGIRIESEANKCTVGFVVRSKSDYRPYLLTAGHCVDGPGAKNWFFRRGNGQWTHIGKVHNMVYGKGGDVAIIPLGRKSRVRADVYVTPSQFGPENKAYPIREVGESVVGARVCHTGIASGTTCGRVTRVRQSARVSKNVTLTNLTVASFCSKPGDSGGPVFSYGKAYGIVSGAYSGCDGRSTWGSDYTELSSALAGLRVRLVTQANP